MGYQSFVIGIGDEANGEYPVTADFQGVTRTAAIPARSRQMTGRRPLRPKRAGPSILRSVEKTSWGL